MERYYTSKHWRERMAYATTAKEALTAEAFVDTFARLEELEKSPLTRLWAFLKSFRITRVQS